MDKNKTVTIKGQRYDAQTGMPVDPRKALTAVEPAGSANRIHGAPQKSMALIRRVTKKPVMSLTGRPSRVIGRTMDIARSGRITRFAPHPVTPPKTDPSTADIPASTHPAVNKARQLQASKQAGNVQTPKSAKDLKKAAIADALAKPTVKTKRTKFLKRHPSFISILSVGIAVVLLGAYLTYINMPSLSVRVAAIQSGIQATYPEYRPDGYRINGPVTYSDGQVSLNFVANTGNTKFCIEQSKSSWDSSAVLDNIVRKKVGENYITSQERGLTVYTYDGNAAWVNAGILYTIDGNAPLSGEQIRRIATSL